MADLVPSGAVYWIDHYVVGTNDMVAWVDWGCGVQREQSSKTGERTLVLRLRAGARIVYKLVDRVDERVSGHGTWWDMHTALTVREEEFLPNYRRMWQGIPEEAGYKGDLNLTVKEQEALPARTGLHRRPVGLKWKEICDRGDEFFDWDCHSFHFMGGRPLAKNGSMALYESVEQEEYLVQVAESVRKRAHPGLMDGLGNENPFKVYEE